MAVNLLSLPQTFHIYIYGIAHVYGCAKTFFAETANSTTVRRQNDRAELSCFGISFQLEPTIMGFPCNAFMHKPRELLTQLAAAL